VPLGRTSWNGLASTGPALDTSAPPLTRTGRFTAHGASGLNRFQPGETNTACRWCGCVGLDDVDSRICVICRALSPTDLCPTSIQNRLGANDLANDLRGCRRSGHQQFSLPMATRKGAWNDALLLAAKPLCPEQRALIAPLLQKTTSHFT
jgi:hypothetical protein